MKSILPILLHVIIVLPLILPRQAFAQSPEWETESLPQPEINRNGLGEDANDNPPQEESDTASKDSAPLSQQQQNFPTYGPATILQEDVGSSIIKLLPAYAGTPNMIEMALRLSIS